MLHVVYSTTSLSRVDSVTAVKGRSHCVRRRTTSYVRGSRNSWYVHQCMNLIIKASSEIPHWMGITGISFSGKFWNHFLQIIAFLAVRAYKTVMYEHVSISAFHDVRRRTTSRIVWMPPILCTYSIRTTTYDVVRRRTHAVWTPL